MKRGFHVSGSVEVPAGIDPAKVLVSLHTTSGYTAQTFDAVHTASVVDDRRCIVGAAHRGCGAQML